LTNKIVRNKLKKHKGVSSKERKKEIKKEIWLYHTALKEGERGKPKMTLVFAKLV
jgi:hypothetical protein